MTTNVLTANQVKEMLLYVADKIIESKPLLTEVDSKIGDGDHGIGMAGGMEKVKETLGSMEPNNVYAVFTKAGNAMLMSMGGASGVIFGSMYLGGARGQEPKSELTARDFAELMQRSLKVIKDRGKAEIGDKTMVDALEPATDAMLVTADNGFEVMLKAGEDAAEQGVENTKQYQAKFGRSKSLLERAIGHQDAGATSVYIILRSMREFVENKG